MSTHTILDYRRTDLRSTVLTNPYWITSNLVSVVDGDDLICVVFSFSAANYPSGLVLIHYMCVNLIVEMQGGTELMTVGAYTLATDAVTTAGVATLVDVDEYYEDGDIDETTAGFYWSSNGNYFDAMDAATWAAPAAITPADTAVPCIAVVPTSNAPLTGGTCRVICLISEIPMT